ncbi:MAG TPA: ABC transporter substrate-binding protein [Gaiellaceae bacterium]|jgi:peptide/nickel transport system substrate-binding protein
MTQPFDLDRVVGEIDRREFLRRAGLTAGGLSLAAVLAPGKLVPAASAESGGSSEIASITWGLNQTVRSLDHVHNFDFTTGEAVSLCLESLLKYDAKGDLQPSLAKSWSQPNATTIVFKLRPGVKFHDGSPLRAEDAAFSMSLHLSKQVSSQLASYYTSVKWIRATAPDEVTIKLKNPSPFVKYNAAFQAGLVVPKAFWQAHPKNIGTSGVLTVGTGPWKVTEFVPDDHITYVRNDEYWGPKPNIRQIVIRFIEEDATRLLAMRSGQIDGAFDLPLQGVDQWQKLPNVKVTFASALQMPYVILNVQAKPYDDIHVRRAIAYSLDKTGIVNALLKGHGQPALSMAFPEQWAGLLSSAQVKAFYKGLPQFPYDLAKAKAELAKSAYPNGFKASTKYANGIQIDGKVALVLAESLKKIGVTLDVQEVQTDQWVAELYAHKPRMHFSLFGADYPDPANFVAIKLNSAGAIPNGQNFANYKNPTVDKLLVKQERATTPQARAAAIKQVLRISGTDLPYVPVVWQQGAMAISSKYTFTGFSPWYYAQAWAQSIKEA